MRQPRAGFLKESEQPADPSVLVHVDLLRGGDLGQTLHGEDIAGQGHDEARAGRSKKLPPFSVNPPFSFCSVMSCKQVEDMFED